MENSYFLSPIFGRQQHKYIIKENDVDDIYLNARSILLSYRKKNSLSSQSTMRTTFRSKVLTLATHSNPESILNIIGLVKKNKQTRQDLSRTIAKEAGEFDKSDCESYRNGLMSNPQLCFRVGARQS